MEPDSRGMENKPHEAIPTTPQGAALGETVKAGLATDKTRDALAGYSKGGVERALGDLADCVRSQPISALLVAMGVGFFLGVLQGRGHGCDSSATRDQA